MAIKAVVFDLDDTLWDVNPVIRRAEQVHYQWLNNRAPKLTARFTIRELKGYRISLAQRHPELSHFVTRSRMKALHECLLLSGYSESETQQISEQAFAVFWQARNQIEPFPYAIEALEGLKRDYLVGALSNGNADVFQTPLGEWFDFAFSAEGLSVAKPDARAFQAVLDHLDCQPDEIAFVGDNPEHDIEGAKAMGMKTIWVQVKPWLKLKQPVECDQQVDDLQHLHQAVRALDQAVV
ncbi:HAD family hydrolase [Oceanospirillum beijerinckii]|uniref:HAD family hydrolase n=1 Tax=Oceanospirillum beijerinckii TaxID=64976 RepID=UPI0004152709|nr:HAD family hydrolase [Oceanospirillum beijerinckii]